MNTKHCHLKNPRFQQIEKRENHFTATVMYLENGASRQKSVSAPTEQKLLETIFMLRVDAFPEITISIKQVHYCGQLLYWDEFLAHYHFAKNRMSFEDFKTACLNPEKVTA